MTRNISEKFSTLLYIPFTRFVIEDLIVSINTISRRLPRTDEIFHIEGPGPIWSHEFGAQLVIIKPKKSGDLTKGPARYLETADLVDQVADEDQSSLVAVAHSISLPVNVSVLKTDR